MPASPTAILRRHALRIFKAALKAADPAEAIRRQVTVTGGVLQAGRKRYLLAEFRNVYVLGAGKATAPMAQAVEQLFGKRITAGVINVKDGHTAPLRRVEQVECAHPVPDERGIAGAARIAELARQAGADDLVLCLISGGASALLPLPAPPLTLEQKQVTTQLLLRSGAAIGEVNAVRKHLSAIKGGQLARLCAPATVISLMLSDVIGDDLAVIGSGPTAPDTSTFADALSVLDRHGLRDGVPSAVRERLEQGAAGALPETPKPGDPLFRRVQNLVVGSSALAVEAAASEARALGYRPLILTTRLEGEAREVARALAAIAHEAALDGRPVRSPACLIAGGETTVTVRGTGKGGRNQELALAAALDLAGAPRLVLLSGGTDGTDGPTDAAGAIVDGETVARAESAGLNARAALMANDSYPLLDATGDLLRTGPTGTNVMDVQVMLVG